MCCKSDSVILNLSLLAFFFFFYKDYDHTLWTDPCSVRLGSDSVVHEECQIECPSLPHGIIDIVAGHIHQGGEGGEGGDMQDAVKLSIGVTIKSTNRDFQVDNPFAMSTKTPQKLLTYTLGEYTC